MICSQVDDMMTHDIDIHKERIRLINEFFNAAIKCVLIRMTDYDVCDATGVYYDKTEKKMLGFVSKIISKNSVILQQVYPTINVKPVTLEYFESESNRFEDLNDLSMSSNGDDVIKRINLLLV